MKENELMIGDWVKFPIGNEKVCDLPYVGGKGLCASFSASATLFPVEVDKLEPIPLTPEILEKNGFKKAVPDNYYPEPRYVWGIDSGRNGTIVTITIYEKPIHGVKMLTKIDTDCSHACGINSIHNCDIESVHDLQHALRLCGISKEIVL